MKENSKFKPLITYFIWLICFLLIQSAWVWIFLKFRIGDGFDLQKRILIPNGNFGSHHAHFLLDA